MRMRGLLNGSYKEFPETFTGFPGYDLAETVGPKESFLLRLDSSKSKQRLGWRPRWSVEKSLASTWQWLEAYLRTPVSVRGVCTSQVSEYLSWK